MFEKLLRRTLLKDFSKDDQETAMLLKEKIKVDLIASLLIVTFGTLPLATLLTLLTLSEHTISNIIQCVVMILCYIIFAFYFVKRFFEPLTIFKEQIAASLYFSKYTVKGNALLKEDFDIIKKENEKLYSFIMHQQCNGYCYSVCFELLKCLKKGVIQFVAVKSLETEKKENENDYTMHVLYVNNNWCFDTYSQRQYPLDEAIKRFKAKTYKYFSSEDIEGKTYEEFKEEYAPALKLWCKENNCYQKWSKD